MGRGKKVIAVVFVKKKKLNSKRPAFFDFPLLLLEASFF
jgi:hypothetical protein